MKLTKNIVLLGLSLLLNSTIFPVQIKREQLTQDILGITEDQFRILSGWQNNQILKAQVKPLDSIQFNTPAYIKDYSRRAAIFQGILTIDSVGDLRNKTKGPIRQGTPSFTIRFYNPDSPEYTDIRANQANPSNKGAAFQLASTFAAQEGGIGAMESKVQNMLHAAVQGEEAAFSAVGAALFRKYFQQPINLLYKLDDPNRYPGALNKLRVDYKGLITNPKKITQFFSDADIPYVSVAIHKNIVVTSGFGDYGSAGSQEQLPIFLNQDGMTVDTTKTQTITQILTAAFSTIDVRKNNIFSSNLESMSKMLLKGAFEGTLRAAYLSAQETKNPRVFLTLVGAGAFRNEVAWIADALEPMKDFIKFAGLEVILSFFPDKNRDHSVRTAVRDIEFLERVFKLIEQINDITITPDINDAMKQYVNTAYAHQKDLYTSNPIPGLSALAKRLNDYFNAPKATASLVPSPTSPRRTDGTGSLKQALIKLSEALIALNNEFTKASSL